VDYLPDGTYVGNGIAPGDGAGGGLPGVIPLDFDLGDIQANVELSEDEARLRLSSTQGNTTSSVTVSTNGTVTGSVSTSAGGGTVTATGSTNGGGSIGFSTTF
jgi:hypothetical protein